MVFIRLLTALAGLSTLKAASLEADEGHRARQMHRGRPKGQSSLVQVKSVKSFEDTYTDLKKALENNPNIKIIADIDHSAAAQNAGFDLLPNRVIVFGNPALGTPVMEQNLLAGLDLPQKMLIWEDAPGVTRVAYNPPEYIEARYKGTRKAEATSEKIASALRNFASSATGIDVNSIRVPKKRNFGSIRAFKGLYCVKSMGDFETTWSRLLKAINADGGPSLAFSVDHGANSEGKLGNSRLVVFGNPVIGTPLMKLNPLAGIDLPLKILVTEDDNDGTVLVCTNKVGFLKKRHKLNRIKANLEAVRNAVLMFVNIAAGIS